jgi:cation diffusion facilitator family transporter
MTMQLAAEHEKQKAALSSVVAAVGLTALKIVVGILTGSLGILAEAAHSGLDLVAALVTFFAVRVSARPPDKEHLFGHGKVENLSALVEALLLLLTCGWIIYEAVRRLFFESAELDISIWAFVVMGISIIVDVSRSRMLYRVARKYNSQALEADALHFSTDIWSSSVVLVGLLGVKIGEWVPALSFLQRADAVAALVVALIVIKVSVELGVRAVQALMDASLPGTAGQIDAAVEAVPGVVEAHGVRLRHSGPHVFADLHILVDGRRSLDESHAISEAVEAAVRQMVPDADVTVHAEPAPQAAASEAPQVPDSWA